MAWRQNSTLAHCDIGFLVKSRYYQTGMTFLSLFSLFVENESFFFLKVNIEFWIEIKDMKHIELQKGTLKPQSWVEYVNVIVISRILIFFFFRCWLMTCGLIVVEVLRFSYLILMSCCKFRKGTNYSEKWARWTYSNGSPLVMGFHYFDWTCRRWKNCNRCSNIRYSNALSVENAIEEDSNRAHKAKVKNNMNSSTKFVLINQKIQFSHSPLPINPMHFQ